MMNHAAPAGELGPVSASVLSFARGVAVLRSPEAEAGRRRRIAVHRVGAFRRAVADDYTLSDLGLHGPAEQLMAAGPGIDPRLTADEPDVA